MASEPVSLGPEDSERVREEATRRGIAPERLAHEAVVEFLERRRLGFVGIVTGSREDFRAADADEILEREGFGRS